MTADLADFLLARIAEDEVEAACAADTVSDRWWADGQSILDPDGEEVTAPMVNYQVAWHVTRWDPARVLAECQAKRRIVSTWQNSALNVRAGDTHTEAARAEPGLAHVLRLLALPYAQHPDYRKEWVRDEVG